MSNAQPQGGQPVNPNAYPSPSYPSPSLSNNNSSYNYPPPNPQQARRESHVGRSSQEGEPVPAPGVLDPSGAQLDVGPHPHPACRNCQKSKRECMGYDPIFKQQPGTAAIQIAPSSASAQSGLAATANPYQTQPQMSYGMPPATTMGYENSLSAGVSSPGSANQNQFDQNSYIDPALEAAGPASVGGYQSSSGMPQLLHDTLRREMHSASPYSSNASDTPHLRGGASSFVMSPSIAYSEEDDAYTIVPARRTVAQLLNLGGSAPASSPADLSQLQNRLEESKHLYYSIYAPGLENFLETKWFSNKGLNQMLGNKELMDQFGVLLHQFGKVAQQDPKEMAYTASIEARIVWSLANMVRQRVGGDMNGNKELRTVPAIDDPMEAANRLSIFESLLTSKVATSNPLTAPVPGSTDHHRLRELEFWHTLGNFVCLEEDDQSVTVPKDTDDILANLRNLLDGRENRDVLYSIAVVRAIGPRIQEYTPNETPLHLDESDNKSKLLVAKKFVQDEAQGHGTTNVIRRLSAPVGAN
ncbi:hypothetical protein M7I_2782 [Glarea lozoyensis 74030]|uniref:Zn2/Cys6 DNA-binding protein n=1 Tax=Glarea lozoyensis (strain ATCC 74030 / MF5533) TaxID=1104152 RepID=H0EJQ2_GLAL7|nr:hypothetical protein M7I_2782 [Glarea lozoyensis 74030]